MSEKAINKDRRLGIIVTAVFHCLVIAAFFIFGFRYLDPPPEKGMIIAYGIDLDGFGEPAYSDVPPEIPERQTSYSTQVPQDESYVTQTEDSPVTVEAKKQEDKPDEQAEIKPTDQQQPQPSRSTLAALANVFSDGTDKGKGDGQGDGFKGSPDGSPASDNYIGTAGAGGDGNYSLGNRKPLNKPQPQYSGNDQGRVVVRIKVDRNGNVISAQAGAQGTTISEASILKNAEAAAMKTKWQANEAGEPVQEGTIIYEFRLRK